MSIHRWCVTLGAAALLASCADYGAPDEVVFGEAVYTQQSPTADFSQLNTYFLDPTIRVMDDTGIPQEVALPPQVAQAIRDNMTAYGYTEVTTPVPPNTLPPNVDLGIKLAVLQGTGAVYYPGYWCDYWAYPYCYYDYVYAGTYEFGAVVIGMGDTRVPPDLSPGNGRLPIVWTSAVYGVSQGTQLNIQRAVEGINRAFAQSPYLDKTP